MVAASTYPFINQTEMVCLGSKRQSTRLVIPEACRNIIDMKNQQFIHLFKSQADNFSFLFIKEF